MYAGNFSESCQRFNYEENIHNLLSGQNVSDVCYPHEAPPYLLLIRYLYYNPKPYNGARHRVKGGLWKVCCRQ
jgi:hypothetical protein